MGVIKKVFWIIIIIILSILIYASLYVYSLSKIDVKAVRINSLQDISLSGFTLGGEVDVYNDGIITVGISKITYSLALDGTGTQLASGVINGDDIPVKETASFPFSNKISWIPTAEVAWNLITPGKTYATLSGTVHVADVGFFELKKPFEQKIDLEPYIKQFARDQVQGTLETATGVVTNTIQKIGEGIKTVTGNIVKGIGKLLD
jgi:hypothetical protein